MKNKAGYKIIFLALALTAAAFCALPFLAHKTTITVYPVKAAPNAEEQAFIAALKQQGYKVKLSPSSSDEKDIAVWFRSPDKIAEVAKSPAQYNFMYSNAHYPFNWQEYKKLPIVLTPHQDLYEHYTRSNIKAAVFPQINAASATKAAARLKELIDWLNKAENN